MSKSKNTIEQAGNEVHQGINALINKVLEKVPVEDQQGQVDALRGVHQALAYHLGTVEQLILRGFGDDATEQIIENLGTERADGIERGYEHGRFHENGYTNGH